MPISDARKRANDRYDAKCGRIGLRPLKAETEAIKAAAARNGESLQGYILKAVRERMKKEQETE